MERHIKARRGNAAMDEAPSGEGAMKGAWVMGHWVIDAGDCD